MKLKQKLFMPFALSLGLLMSSLVSAQTYKVAIGDEQDTVNDAAMGLLDFSVLAINNVTPFSPSVAILTLPYLIRVSGLNG